MSDSELLESLFSEIPGEQRNILCSLPSIYRGWNEKINLISRRDIDNVMRHHIVHSLFILKVASFRAGARVLDFGTGGGFPGIPLALACPDVRFHLIDSIGKKVRVVESIAHELNLPNVTCEQVRGEELHEPYDCVVSRAVSDLSQLWRWSKPLLRKDAGKEAASGLFVLKGGTISPEVSPFGKRARAWRIADWISDPYFHEKYVVHVLNV